MGSGRTASAPEGTWEQLVTAALLGTARRPLTRQAALDGAAADLARTAALLPARGDPGVDVLDLAALAVQRDRAGRRPRPAAALAWPQPAPAETLPYAGAAATARLQDVLALGDADLLAEWLTAAAHAGRLVPPSLLVRLLTLTSTHEQLRRLVLAAGGRRAAWLVQQWREAQHPLAVQEQDAELPDERTWPLLQGPARRAGLAALRRSDPARAAALLAQTWASEVPAERADLLASFATGLSGADEPLLELALDDRRARTREVAAALLAALPGSALGQRMAQRALAAVHLERRGARSRLVVRDLPVPDAACLRDGVPPYRGQGGHGRWVLVHVLAGAPTTTWAQAWGAGPAQILGWDVEGGWAGALHEGWARAAIGQRDADWAAALLALGGGGLAHDALVGLVEVLPPRDRARLAAGLLDAGISARAGERWMLLDVLLHRCPAPWPPGLTDAVLAWLRRLRPDEAMHISRGLVRLAARRLPPQAAPAVAATAAARGPDLLRPMLSEAADLLAFRRDLHEELTS